jgi:hypothetical protein
MKIRFWLCRLALAGIMALAGVEHVRGAEGGAPLRVQAQVPPGTYYVGQGIELRVGVEAAGEKPQVFAPRLTDAEIALIRVDTVQRGSTAIGNRVEERILYVFRYRMVPRRPGELSIPPVHARVAGRSGAGAPVKLLIHALPLEGRPASFLGGVGRLEAGAEAWPTTVRVGQTAEYRLRLVGPGARGSARLPDLDGFRHLGAGLEVEPLPPEVVADPPSRVLRYRLKPTRPGEVVLPPVAVATFDPVAGQYLTRAAPGVAIRVVDVPRFDPNTLRYAPVPGSPGRSEPAVIAPARWLSWLLALTACLLAWPAVRTTRKLLERAKSVRDADPIRFARGAARRLDQPFNDSEALSTWIAQALAHYLLLAAGRPEGALTPLEAREAFEGFAEGSYLADRAARLVAECDRARFSGRGVSAEELAAGAAEMFQSLSRLPRLAEPLSAQGAEEPQAALGETRPPGRPPRGSGRP